MRTLAVVALLLVSAVAAGAASSPRFVRSDGSAILVPGAVRAWCDTEGLHVLTLGRINQSRWQLSVARRDVRPGRSVAFTWMRRHGIEVFVFDAKTRNEASEGTEGSRGRIMLRRATCRRGGMLALGLSGTIGSEFSDGKPIRMSGTFQGRVGVRPGR